VAALLGSEGARMAPEELERLAAIIADTRREDA
jgi:hypothetical protein